MPALPMIESKSRVQCCVYSQETFVVDPEKLEIDLKDNDLNILFIIMNRSVHVLLHDIM